MNILICPNAFKGSLDAIEAAEAISRGFNRSRLSCETQCVPIADGGDGSLVVIAKHLGAEIIKAEVRNPVGDRIIARYGFKKQQLVAIIEMAESSGIRLIKEDQLNPWRLTSYGTGELIKHAVENGAKEIYLTLGGSATVDGAIGLLNALGVLFIKAEGEVVEYVDMNIFHEVEKINVNVANSLLGKVKFTILSDVTNPLLGVNGAASVFGPQKGLEKKDTPRMEKCLEHLAKLIKTETSVDIESIEGGGAAGGIAATLYGLFGATIVSGGEQILAWSGFDDKLTQADFVITGEGKIDQQTAFGKGPGLVALKAKRKGIPVIGICGAVDDNQMDHENFQAIFPINSKPMELAEAMTHTAASLERTALQIGNLLATKDLLKKS